MTTGRKGVFVTPVGTIEYTHTQRNPIDIVKMSLVSDRPLRIAKVETALRDLRRVGRNMHMVSMEDYYEILAERDAEVSRMNTPKSA